MWALQLRVKGLCDPFKDETPGGLMDQKNLEYFKNVFFDLKKNCNGELLEAKEVMNLEQNGDEVDTATTERERELTLKIQGRSRFFYKKIDDALSRINSGTFGQCEECGDEIEINRLKARPMTNLCICCKEAEEREEQSIPYTKRSHTLGKAIVGGNALIEENRPQFQLIDSSLIN